MPKQNSPLESTELVEQIQYHSDFVNFAHALLKNLKEKPDEWEHRDLAGFLEAMVAWIEDMYGYYQGKGEALPLQPRWKMLGEILLAAKVYE